MIRLANPSDLDAIAEIYEEILAAEDARPASYTNWQRGKYPTRDTAEAALEAGTLWGGGGGRSGIRLRQPERGAAARVRRHPLVHPRPAGGGGGDPHSGHPAQLVGAGKGPGVCGLLRGGAPPPRGKRRSAWTPMREISPPTPCTPAWATPSRGPRSFSSRGLFMKF